MDLDFAMCRPLVRRLRLISGFCSSARTFDPRFLQTPPRDGSPCVSLTLHLHQVGWKTFTSELLSMPGTRLNRSRGRALRRVAWPWMDDGSVLPDDEGPEIVQHDDRAISHRQRWERTELSVTTSASRIVSNTRTDAVEDAVMIYKANSKQFRWTLSRGNICSTDAVQRLLSGT
jgi:hypothetical protein